MIYKLHFYCNVSTFKRFNHPDWLFIVERTHASWEVFAPVVPSSSVPWVIRHRGRPWFGGSHSLSRIWSMIIHVLYRKQIDSPKKISCKYVKGCGKDSMTGVVTVHDSLHLMYQGIPGNLASIEAPVFNHLGSFAAPGVATVTGPVEFYDDSCMRRLGVVEKWIKVVHLSNLSDRLMTEWWSGIGATRC